MRALANGFFKSQLLFQVVAWGTIKREICSDHRGDLLNPPRLRGVRNLGQKRDTNYLIRAASLHLAEVAVACALQST